MVYVINQDNTPLMPCSNAIARLLLKQDKEVFADKKKKAVDKLCRSSRNGFRSLLYKEVYKDDVLFLFLFQTAKHSEQVVLSKKYLENQEENLNFFKKIKDICNPSNIFADFSVYEKE
jgi:hypothetical protein